MIHRKWGCRCVAAAVVVVASAGAAHADWEVYRFQLDGASLTRIYAGVGVGSLAGFSYYSTDPGQHACVFTGLTMGTLVNLHPTGAIYSEVYGTNGTQYVGLVKLGNGSYAGAVWNGLNQTPVLFPTPAGYASVQVSSTDGTTQGGRAYSNGYPHARLWHGTAASMVSLEPPGAAWSDIVGVSGGVQAGYATIGGTTLAGVWHGTAASWMSLNPESYTYTQGFCLSPDGSQVGGWGRPNGSSWNQAMIWNGGTATGFVNLHPPGTAAQSSVTATDGVYQAGYFEPVQYDHAVVWNGTAGSYVDLHPLIGPDATDSQATGVWHDSTGLWVCGIADLGPDFSGPGIGVVWHLPATCYANCDGSTAAPVLNIADFTCFLEEFAAGEPSANCDGSTAAPVLNVLDFTCFLQKFAAGCP